MIQLGTIIAARREMGLPTDDETLAEERDRLENLLSERIEVIRSELWERHKRDTGATYMDEHFLLDSVNRARVQATEEILEEEINAPLRDYYEQNPELREDEDY